MRPRLLTLSCLLLMQGCIFSERSYPYDASMRMRIDPPVSTDGKPVTPRQWLARAAPQLDRLRPPHRHSAMLTDQLVTPAGQPADVVAHFEIKTDELESIFSNPLGLIYSAQAIMPRSPPHPAPPWKGFEDVWIPVAPDLKLCGRLGYAHDADGRPVDADCIVIVPGIRGDNNILRVRDLARALVDNGLHVLSLEVRGAGQTDMKYPKYEFTWNILGAEDILRVADWLQAKPHIRRTGLVGYSWGANLPLLAVWTEGRTSDEGIPPRLKPYLLLAPRGPRRFEAGMIAFSPIIRFEPLMDQLMVEHAAWRHPALAGLQETIRDRMIHRKYPNPCGSIREIIKHVNLGYDGEVEDGLEYLRLLPYKNLPAHDRLNSARVPLLIVHSADDMLGPAQEVADLMATVHNPNVAAMILPSGGHVGFGPYAPAWYYNLILNFFDPVVGVAARPG